MLKNRDHYYLFLPIKGFEQATYKRASLNRPSPALTTKMSIGNSDTLHPIFNRTWTPQEVMVLFGLGYILNDEFEYEMIDPYKIPFSNNPKKLSNLIFEICGEGIISIVAQKFMEQLMQQFLYIDDNLQKIRNC